MGITKTKDERKDIKIDEETWYVLAKVKLENRYARIADAINHIVKENKKLKTEKKE